VTIAVLLVNCAEAINICFLFPFMAFMLEDMGYTGHRLGYYCGGLAASFCTGQFCSSVAWGWLSDKYGRKPTLVLGTLGTAVGTAVFGFARSYPQAIAGRITSGLLSGNLGILKSYLTEITDDSNRTKAFAILQTSGSIGNIIGPLIGGMLASPAIRYPHIFRQDSIWAEYPYLFPCMLCVINSIVASAMCSIFLKETNVAVLQAQQLKGQGAGAVSGTLDESVRGMDSSRHPMIHSTPDVNSKPATPAKTYVILGEGEEEEEDEDEAGKEREGESKDAGLGSSLDEEQPISSTVPLPSSPSPPPPPPPPPLPSNADSVLRERVVLQATGAYGLLAFSYIIIDETLPLFMKFDVAKGGLSFTSSEIGFVLSCSGAVMLCFNMLILPTLGKYSKLTLYKTTNLVAIPFTMAWPLAGLLNSRLVESHRLQPKSPIMYLALLGISSVKNSLAVVTFTAVIILVNHSVPSRYLGKVNGMGQSFAALARAAGPALGGALWSITIRYDCVFLNFIFASCMLALGQVIVSYLPASLDHKREEQGQEHHQPKEIELASAAVVEI